MRVPRFDRNQRHAVRGTGRSRSIPPRRSTAALENLSLLSQDTGE
jgi:hypothetical protein